MTTFPSNPSVGSTQTLDAVTYVYNGSVWQASWAISVPHLDNIEIIESLTEPPGVPAGVVWLNSSTRQLKKYDGSVWTVIATGV